MQVPPSIASAVESGWRCNRLRHPATALEESCPRRGHGLVSPTDPGCVKSLRGISAPGILSPVVMRRVRKRENLSSARHYDQINFHFHTAKTQSGQPRHEELRKTCENRYSQISHCLARCDRLRDLTYRGLPCPSCRKRCGAPIALDAACCCAVTRRSASFSFSTG